MSKVHIPSVLSSLLERQELETTQQKQKTNQKVNILSQELFLNQSIFQDNIVYDDYLQIIIKLQQMTCYLNIYGIQQFQGTKNKEYVLRVVSNKMGQVTSPQLYAREYQWKNPFQVICPVNDILTFQLYEASVNPQYFIASAEVRIQKLLQMCKLLPGEIKQQTIELLCCRENQSEFSGSEATIGLLHFTIRFDPGLLFQGQIQGAVNLQIELEAQTYQPKNRVNFYKGQCPKSNFFNFMDQGSKNTQCKFVESTFKDEM